MNKKAASVKIYSRHAKTNEGISPGGQCLKKTQNTEVEIKIAKLRSFTGKSKSKRLTSLYKFFPASYKIANWIIVQFFLSKLRIILEL